MNIPKLLSSLVIIVSFTVFLSNCKSNDPAPSGKAVFWTAEQTLGGASVDVTIDGTSVGAITSYSSTGAAPACGTAGYVTVNKPAGVYDFIATGSDGTTWEGNVIVTNDNCTKKELTADNANPGQVVFFIRSDLKCGAITVNIAGLTDTITAFYSSATISCGLDGCATFTLPPGEYTFTASCTGLTWNNADYVIPITSGGCYTLELQ